MNIMDLAEAVAPGCRYEFVGIRPGEKLHEVLISEDDGRRTLEFEKFFIIQPDFPWWGAVNSKGAKQVSDGFKYTSDTNNEWVSVQELRSHIGVK